MKRFDLGRAKRLALLLCALPLCGCADLLPFAGFGGTFALGPFRDYVQTIPVHRVTAQIECELREFLVHRAEQNRQNPGFDKLRLDPKETAGITLTLQTDESGGVTYTGVDLTKLGLAGLGEFVSATNRIPNLQAKAQMRGTVSAQLDLVIPQSTGPVGAKKPKFRGDPKPGVVWANGLGTQPCPRGVKAIVNYPIKLFIKEWLTRFFDDYNAGTEDKISCLSKLTMKTSFQLLLGISGGVNLAAVPIIVLPISGLNGEYSPAFTHSVQIVFSLAENNNTALCRKESPQPTIPIGGRG